MLQLHSKMERKGVSPIIASVLILMLTIVAVVLIATFVIPFLRDSLSGSTECLPYRDYYSFDESFGFNCYEGDTIHFSVKAGTLDNAEQLNEFRIVLLGESGSKAVPIKEGESGLTGYNGAAVEIPKTGEIISYSYDAGGTNFKSMEIYPVLESGKICDMTDSIKLTNC